MLSLINNLSIKAKLWTLTGFLILAILSAGLASSVLIDTILHNNSEYIVEAGYNEEILHKEIDHLRWVKNLEDLFVHNHETLDLELDHTRCGLGRFLGGDDVKNMANLSPEVSILLEEIKAPHRELHESAKRIKTLWRQKHPGLGLELSHRLTDHLKWMQGVSIAIMGGAELDVETDPNNCKFGKWTQTREVKELAAQWPDFADLLNRAKAPHVKLHESSQRIALAGAMAEKVALFNDTAVPAYEELARLFNRIEKLEAGLEVAQHEAKKIFERETMPALESVFSILDRLRGIIEAHENILKKEMISAGDTAKVTMISLVALSFLVGCGFSILIIRSVTRPLGRAVEMANTMAGGDFTARLMLTQRDEVGLLAESLNHTAASLGDMFRSIVSGVQTLNASSTGLTAVSEQIAANSEQTASRADTVAASAEEMSSGMNNVAAATEEADANIRMIVAATEEMTATIAEIAGNTAKGSDTTQRAVGEALAVSSKVNELGKASVEIGKVTEAIAEISEQTNLLALNAGIEAARAGDAGKGFAVVAGEIKTLARQTAEATREISLKIAEVQDSTEDSVNAIQSIVSIITETNEIVTGVASAIEEQSATTREISSNVAQAATGVGEISENVNRTSAVAGEVTQEVAQVSRASSEMNSGSREVNQNALGLASLAGKLDGMVKKFKI